jgi:phage FluMu protein Com
MMMIRCIACKKVLFEADIKEGIVKKKCKCGTMNIISVEKPANQAFQDRAILAKK